MKKIIYLVVISSAISLCACKSRPPLQFLPTTLTQIGTTATVGIGERLLTKGDGTISAIVIPRDQAIGNVLVHKGRYAKTERNAEYTSFEDATMSPLSGGPNREGNLYLFSKDNADKTVCLSRKICANLDYTPVIRYEESAFQQTLLYNGKIGSRITLAYREFASNIARPAFNNDVTYDLSESAILGYKGARLEVVKATNTEITYKVLVGFD